MQEVILGIFVDRVNAEDAVEDLKVAGYAPEDISIVMRDRKKAETIRENTGANIAGGAVSGATTGGVIGGIAGLLIGIGAVAIPGVGAFLIGGPLAAAFGLTGAAATAVSGAATGVLAGGLLGAFIGLGIPEEDARYYDEQLKEGAILIAVPATHRTAAEAQVILEDNGADRVRAIVMDEDRFKSTHLH